MEVTLTISDFDYKFQKLSDNKRFLCEALNNGLYYVYYRKNIESNFFTQDCVASNDRHKTIKRYTLSLVKGKTTK